MPTQSHARKSFTRGIQFGPGAVGIGWDMGFLGLAGHLSAPDTSVDPQNAAAWAAAPEGQEFMHLSSNAWAEAAVASGDDPAAAQERADRVYAMYTATE